MIQFRPLAISQKAAYDEILALAVHRGCEYNFTNLYLWGQQRYAMVDGFMVLFSQFSEKSVYPYPVGKGDPKAALDAIRQDTEAEMDEAVKFADASPYPDPATVLDDMYVTDNERCVAR